jgi:hypothetical protein
MLEKFKRNGLHLEEAVRGRVKAIKERMSKLAIEFSKHCNEENTKFEFTAAELDGLPDADLSTCLCALDSFACCHFPRLYWEGRKRGGAEPFHISYQPAL